MSLFSKSEVSYLGVDFHSNAIKVVELKKSNNHKSQLVTYGYVDLNLERSPMSDSKESLEQIAKVIRQVCQQSRTTTTNVITSLPAYSVFSSILNLPTLSKKELPASIEREAQKIIPLPLDEMVLDWKILPSNPLGKTVEPQSKDQLEDAQISNTEKRGKIVSEKKQVGTTVLLTAAPKKLVKRYMDIFRMARLNLLTLDTTSFALIRSLVGNDKSALMLVDMGSTVTNITIVVDGIPVMNRSSQVGGFNITKIISKNLNISLERAEQFKYDIGLSKKSSNQAVPSSVATTLAPIIDELKYTLDSYAQMGGKKIEKVIITGGSSLLLNMPNYLSEILNLKVYRGDPWARVIAPEDLRPVLDQIGARYSVPVGLAMRYLQ